MSDVDLTTLSYYQHKGEPLEWSIDGLRLGQINLLVGRNATGKTRSLAIIGGPMGLAANILADRLITQECNFDAVFDVGGKSELRYVLHASEGKVKEEKVYIDDVLRLDRTGTKLKLWYEKLSDDIDLEPAENEVSASARRDRNQVSYLLPLHQWAGAVRYYAFGAALGQNIIAISVKQGSDPEFNDRDQDRIVAIFIQGKKEFPETYVNALLDDMRELGYSLSDIDARAPGHLSLKMGMGNMELPGQIVAIGIQEAGIEGMIFQDSMSQGMFRALSVLAQVNYSQLSQRAHCIMIDDIGEGLDFERASTLIGMLRRKAKHSKFQLIMTTNDQFVMDHVPLDEWSVLQRTGNRVSVKNIHNSRKVFEDFRFVGLSNFSFFEMDFANPESEANRQLMLEEQGGK